MSVATGASSLARAELHVAGTMLRGADKTRHDDPPKSPSLSNLRFWDFAAMPQL